jgi:hypothetical protein
MRRHVCVNRICQRFHLRSNPEFSCTIVLLRLRGIIDFPHTLTIGAFDHWILPLSSSSFIFPPFDDLSIKEDAVIHIVHAESYLKLDECWLSILPDDWTAEDGFPLWRTETRPQFIILPRVIGIGVVGITKFSIDIEPTQLYPELVDQRLDPMAFDTDDVLQHVCGFLLVGNSPAGQLPLAAKLADDLFRGKHGQDLLAHRQFW